MAEADPFLTVIRTANVDCTRSECEACSPSYTLRKSHIEVGASFIPVSHTGA